MAHADDLALIIRAACGDAQSLAALAQRDNQRLWMRLAALLALDPDPPPLALGAALALAGDLPESLRARARARAEATLQALCEPDAAPLIAALRRSPTTFRRAVAAFETLDQTRAAPIFAILDMLDPSADKQPARLSADAAPPVLRAAIPMIIAVAAHDPKSAARAAGALWDVIDDEQRAMLARSAAQASGSAANLMERIGLDGWRIAPEDARRALLEAVSNVPGAAARGGGAVWTALDDAARIMLARRAAQPPPRPSPLRGEGMGWGETAADLMERIGPDGWRVAPDSARRALLDAVADDPQAASSAAAVWAALDDKQRDMIARRAAAADLMERIGPDGWRVAPDSARRALLEAVSNVPGAAARGGAAVWTALDDAARIMLARSAAQESGSAADLMERIGPDGWRIAPEDARRALLDAVTRDHWRAARGGAAVWTALDDEQRDMIANSVAQPPPRTSPLGWGEAAADLVERIGSDGWMVAPEDARRALLDAVTRYPWRAARGGGKVWAALDDAERIMLARSAAQDEFAAADLLKRIGADGWRIAPDDARRALLDAVTHDPWRAARGGGKVWAALDDAEPAMLARSAVQRAEAAADLLASIGADGLDLLAPDDRSAVLNAAFRSPNQARRVAETLWQRMDAAERAAAARSISRDPNELDAWIEQAGAAAWDALDPLQRAAAIERMTRDPDTAARLGIALWDALDNEQRSTIARAAASPTPSPLLGEGVGDAAARLIAGVGERLDDAQIAALVRAALGGASASRVMAQALADGAPWRFWMSLFLPAADDAADVWDAWRAVIHRTPPHVAALLLPQRRPSR